MNGSSQEENLKTKVAGFIQTQTCENLPHREVIGRPAMEISIALRVMLWGHEFKNWLDQLYTSSASHRPNTIYNSH